MTDNWRLAKSTYIRFEKIPVYCNASAAPTLEYANTPTPVLTVYNSTSFTCNSGYVSSASPKMPYYECEPLDAVAGIWSAVNYSCLRVFLLMQLWNSIIELFKNVDIWE